MTPGARVLPIRSNPNRRLAAERGRTGVVGKTGILGLLHSAETAETAESLGLMYALLYGHPVRFFNPNRRKIGLLLTLTAIYTL